MQRPLTTRDTAAFFIPLVLWAQLMMITHSVIHGWLARQPDPTVSLAGFAVAFALNGLFNSAFRSLHQVVLGYSDQRGSFHRVALGASALAVVNMAVVLALAHTVLGDWVYGGMMGAGPAVVAEARAASSILALIFPLQMLRNLAIGLLMARRRTTFITAGTAVRLMALWGFLVGWSFWVEGARLGAAALVSCIGLETLFIVGCAWPVWRRMGVGSQPAGYGSILRFALPLMLNSALENAMVVLVNIVLGRLQQADLALAAFGVARGLLMLMTTPLRNLAQTAQALAHSAEDVMIVRRFALGATLVFVAIIGVLFYSPLQGWVLSDVLGLGEELREAVVPGVLLFALAPFCWSAASLYRGLLAGARRTGVLAFTGFARVAAVSTVALAGLAWPGVNGAALGVAALIAGFGTEALLLRHRYLGLGRSALK